MKIISITVSLLLFYTWSNAQTGITENFNDNQLAQGWSYAAAIVPAETSSELYLNINNITAYDNIEYSFGSIDISANPVVKLKVKTSSAFTMRIDLVDAMGNSTNSIATTKTISGNTYVEYTFNFSGKFNQTYPTNATVNSKTISKVVIFFNAGTSYTGKVYLDDIVIGDGSTTPLFAGIIRKNQIGYEASGSKIALIEAANTSNNYSKFSVADQSNTIVLNGTIGAWKQVNGWSGRYFKTIDFSALTEPGTYQLLVDSAVAGSLKIGSNILFTQTAASVISFFKGMRNTDARDNNLSFYGSRNDNVNVYGGWSDATGDQGKHFSHLSYANHFNPQQIPLVAWSMMRSYEMDSVAFVGFKTEITDEIKWGIDYIYKNLDPIGYFYLSIFDTWGALGATREICEWSTDAGTRSEGYQCAMREGGGVAIAALARASYMKYKSAYTSQQYLAAAVKAYTHLRSPGNGYQTKNLEYCNDHQENIIDNYCGLLAAVELYKATTNSIYLQDAQVYYQALKNKQTNEGWFASDVALNRPFYHAADEGLPIVAIVDYYSISNDVSVKPLLTKWYNWYLSISTEIENPFQYVRQYQKAYVNNNLQLAKKSFFVPHNNETGYWWQGENARLASMSSALLMASRIVTPTFNLGVDSVSAFALSQMDWIVGKNPFGVCMITGFGDKTYAGYNGKTNVTGGICNGISSKDGEETNIEWTPFALDDWQNWRWIEQWLPHNLWFLMASTAQSYLVNNPAFPIVDCNGDIGGVAFIDSCSICAGGNTGISPSLDPAKCVTTQLTSTDNIFSIRIYPNPVESMIRIDTYDLIRISIYDHLGSLVLVSTEQFVDMTALSTGLYVFKVETSNGFIFEKVVKK